MKVAVLMSTYNGHLFLDKQLESIAAQTVVQDLTLYIRDDGSTDGTFDIIEKWKNRINIVLYKGQNAGPAMSFWMLLTNPEIRADYYAFCDQDDVWDANKLEKGIDKLTGNYQLYACNCRIIDENGHTTKDSRLSRIPDMSVKSLFVSGCTQGCSMIFTDKLCQFIRKQNISCVPMHDIVLMLYAKYLGKIYWDIEQHFSYRVHSNNVVAKKNKSFTENIRTTWWNWNNSKKHSMATVAKEMLNNIEIIPDEDRKFLNQIASYKRHRLRIIMKTKRYDLDRASLRSFKIRILFGLY